MIVSYYNSATSRISLLMQRAFLLSVMWLVASPKAFAASDERNLTDIFWQEGFRGSWEAINKFNWIGGVSQILITTICLFGTIGMLWQTLITCLYLSNKGLWDTVYDYQQEDAGQGFMGMKGMFTSVFGRGNRGTGFNSLFGFLFSILPNVKQISDYNPQRMASNLNENDTLTQYLLKTFISKVCMVLVFTMGFSGSLGKAYATMADGLAAVGDSVVEYNLRGTVERLQAKGNSYNFTIDNGNSATAKLAGKIARSLYAKTISQIDNLDKTTMMAVGLKIENAVYSDFMGKSNNAAGQRAGLQRALASGPDGVDNTISTEEDVKDLKWEIVTNTNKSPVLGEKVYSISSFLPDNVRPRDKSEELQFHVIVRKAKISTSNYFTGTEK